MGGTTEGRKQWPVWYASTGPGTPSSPPGRRAIRPPTSRPPPIFREQLAGGYMGVAKLPDDTYEQVKELPADVELVMLRRPIAGG